MRVPLPGRRLTVAATIHLRAGIRKAACGVTGALMLTTVPAEVTCPHCREATRRSEE